MKLIIAGGRDYQLSIGDHVILGILKTGLPVTEVVSGKCRGADKCGEKWAKKNKIHVEPFPADWNGLGKPAGPIRNRKMAEYADAVALFPGGDGTQSMFDEAKIAGIRIFDYRKSKLRPEIP